MVNVKGRGDLFDVSKKSTRWWFVPGGLADGVYLSSVGFVRDEEWGDLCMCGSRKWNEENDVGRGDVPGKFADVWS